MQTVPDTITTETPLPFHLLTCMTVQQQRDALREWGDALDELWEQPSAHSMTSQDTKKALDDNMDSLADQLRSETQRAFYGEIDESIVDAIDAARNEGLRVGIRLGAALQDCHVTGRPLCFLNIVEATSSGTQWADQFARERRLG